MGDKKTISDFGNLLIAISVANLIINILPLIPQFLKHAYRRWIYKLYQIIYKRITKTKRLKALRVRLQARNEEEQKFGRRIEMRANVAAKNLELYERYEKMANDGQLNDHSIAMRTQQHLNLES